MSAVLLSRDAELKDPLQRSLDAIEGYMFFGMKREALQVRMELEDTYYDDPRMQHPPAVVLEVERWIVRVDAALGAGDHQEIRALEAELDPPIKHAQTPA